MKRKTKKYIGIGVVSIIIGAIVFFILLGGIPFQAFYIGGSTALSIDRVEIEDEGELIRIFGVATGAEELTIDWDSEDISDEIEEEGYKATKGVSGSIKLSKQTKRFIIDKQFDELFYKTSVKDIGILTWCGDNECKSKGSSSWEVMRSYRTPTLTCQCVYKYSVGANSIFTGKEILDSKVDFNIGGATGSLEPSSGKNALTLNDGKTKVEWTGDLSNYEDISAPQYSILFAESNFEKLISQNAYTQAKSEFREFEDCISKFLGTTVSNLNSCSSEYNTAIDNLLIDKTSSYTNSINAKGTEFGDNSLNVELKTASRFPTFIITLDASKVGIVELKGEPKIVSCVPSTDINSGDTISPTLRVKNTGSQDGSFFGRVSCSGGASGIISESYFESGETKDMPIQVSGINTKEGIDYSTCEITIEDRNSGRTDTCNFKLGVKYQSGIKCEPDSIRCLDDKTLRTCSEDGKQYSDKECAEKCVVLEDGTGKCGTKQQEKQQEFTCEEKCEEDYSKLDPRRAMCKKWCEIKSTVAIIIAILIGSIVALISMKVVGAFKK